MRKCWPELTGRIELVELRFAIQGGRDDSVVGSTLLAGSFDGERARMEKRDVPDQQHSNHERDARQYNGTIDCFWFSWHQCAQRYEPLENEPKNCVWND